MERVKKYSRNDVKKHNSQTSTWIVIDDKVYDVTKFLHEHPGGEDSILDEAGKDATHPFNDVGHSSEAREMLKKYLIGELLDSEKSVNESSKWCSNGMITAYVVIAAIAVGALVTYKMQTK